MLNSAAAAALVDIAAIDKWCYDHPASPPPPSAIMYIGRNREALLCFIGLVEQLAESNRTALQSQHVDIDGSTVSAEFFSIPRVAVESAYEVVRGNELAELSSDDVHMIHRAMVYAQYVDAADCFDDLVLSPVQLPR